jgi:hypothetical protein
MRLAVVGTALLLCGTTAEAQSLRPFTTFRQLHGETRLTARLEYAAGNLEISPGQPGELYRMDLSYDADRFVPMSDFDAASGEVALGVRSLGQGGIRVASRNQLMQVAKVTLSPRVDLTLDLNLGAAEAQVELGGLRVSALDLKTGASKAVISFSRPNATRCRRASFSAGAAEVSILGLGNSRCDEIEFEGGVGSVTLDFGGTWTSSARVAVNMAMGELTLRLPRQVGIRLAIDKFLSSFEPAGLVRRADEFVSENYDRAARRLDLEITTAVGGVGVEWLDE